MFKKKLKKSIDCTLLVCEIDATHGLEQKQQQTENENKNTTDCFCRRAGLTANYLFPGANSLFPERVVGYVNTPLTPGFTLVNNPLNGTTNGAGQVLSGLTSQENLFIWTGSGYHIYTYQGLGVGTGLGFPEPRLDGRQCGSPGSSHHCWFSNRYGGWPLLDS